VALPAFTAEPLSAVLQYGTVAGDRTLSEMLLRFTDRRTDTVALHRSCSAYYAGIMPISDTHF